VRDRFAELLSPRDAFEARARLDQLYAIANTNIDFVLFSAIIAAMVAVIDLQWVSPARISIWLVTVLASLAWMYWGSRKALSRERGPEEAGRFTLESIVWNTPFMLLWSTMILYVWIPGNVLNNGFLITFLFASMAASVPQSGLCRYVALPGMTVDVALLATHALTGSTLMDWLGPGLQTLAGLLICKLSFTFEHTYRTVAFQRFEKDSIAQELARTADELSRARDFAQEASKAKSEFLANMSHELRTPLNAIIGFSDMIRTEMLGPVNPPKYADYIGDIHKSGLHLLNLINNLLDLAKIEAGKQDLNDVEIALDQAAANALRFVENQARKGGISLSTEIDTGMGLLADERAITQVLTNLLSNAIKFTQPGGDVAVFAYCVDGGGLALGVKDTGIGMEPDEVRRALEPFVQIAHVTTVEGWGTGLGVPLVKALIEIHGGTFHIESHRGIGTCAWGEFPATRTVAAPQISLAG
jgi:two-component system cell cycle sensor histidine kinase PleC